MRFLEKRLLCYLFTIFYTFFNVQNFIVLMFYHGFCFSFFFVTANRLDGTKPDHNLAVMHSPLPAASSLPATRNCQLWRSTSRHSNQTCMSVWSLTAGLNDVVPCTIRFICYLFLQKVGISVIISLSDCHSFNTAGKIYQFVSSAVLILK